MCVLCSTQMYTMYTNIILPPLSYLPALYKVLWWNYRNIYRHLGDENSYRLISLNCFQIANNSRLVPSYRIFRDEIIGKYQRWADVMHWCFQAASVANTFFGGRGVGSGGEEWGRGWLEQTLERALEQTLERALERTYVMPICPQGVRNVGHTEPKPWGNC